MRAGFVSLLFAALLGLTDGPTDRYLIADANILKSYRLTLDEADRVGILSGFDGSGDSMSDGLKYVSDYESLVQELERRGYSREDIQKILSGNLLRVRGEVERLAAL